jgi:hypothetical protein
MFMVLERRGAWIHAAGEKELKRYLSTENVDRLFVLPFSAEENITEIGWELSGQTQ